MQISFQKIVQESIKKMNVCHREALDSVFHKTDRDSPGDIKHFRKRLLGVQLLLVRV